MDPGRSLFQWLGPDSPACASRGDASEKAGGRFVLRVLRDEAARERGLQDCLAKRLAQQIHVIDRTSPADPRYRPDLPRQTPVIDRTSSGRCRRRPWSPARKTPKPPSHREPPVRKSSCLLTRREPGPTTQCGAGSGGGTHIGRAQHHQRGFRAPARCRPPPGELARGRRSKPRASNRAAVRGFAALRAVMPAGGRRSLPFCTTRVRRSSCYWLPPIASRAARATMSRGDAMAAASSSTALTASPPISPSAVTAAVWAR